MKDFSEPEITFDVSLRGEGCWWEGAEEGVGVRGCGCEDEGCVQLEG